jgi:hypothetical protein
MKFRILAVFLIFALAAWLPLAAQQPAAAPASPQSTTPAAPETAKAKPACACCSHDMASPDAAKTEKHDHASMGCCDGKSSGEMACCKTPSADGKAAMECCKDHDAKLCAAKDGKSCCDSKDGKSCCGKDATACNSKDGKDCCSAMNSDCGKHPA